MNPCNYEFQAQKGYQEKAADILLDRLKKCEPSDSLHIVIALKELFEPTITDITSETSIEMDDADTDKRHWTKV